jgi:hypothetical protein
LFVKLYNKNKIEYVYARVALFKGVNSIFRNFTQERGDENLQQDVSPETEGKKAWGNRQSG